MYYPIDLTNNQKIISDRFIPLRNNQEIINTNITKTIVDKMIPEDKRVLRFSKKLQDRENIEKIVETPKRKKKYNINKKPIRVLEAPNLIDDYYLNLVCWSNTNLIGVGLQDSIFLYNFLNNNIKHHLNLTELYEENLEDSDIDYSPYVCSLSFNDSGKNLAVSDSNGQILITDIEKHKIVSNSHINTKRIGSLHWQENLLVSGSRDKTIRIFDLRQKMCNPVISFSGHLQEICGVKISPDNNYIASGGNDNQLLVWDLRRMELYASLGKHEAAVKALAWCPKKKNILVSGSGTSDRKLRIFDVNRKKQLSIIDTGSQICNVTFDKEGDTLLSTHGYSLNQLIVWNMKKGFTGLIKEDVLIAHKLRVLYLANSPCGKYVVTGAGDETLRIWNVFQNRTEKSKKSVLSRNLLRLR